MIMKTQPGSAGAIPSLAILTIAVLMFAPGASASADGESPAVHAEVTGLAADPSLGSAAIPIVESLHNSLIVVMKSADELGYQGRAEAIEPILEGSFDLEFMAKKSIGRSWKKLSEEQQARWVDTFERVTCANYAGRFQGYSGQAFETLETVPGSHETMIVNTVLRNPDGDDVELNYRLMQTEQGWRIVDVYLDGTVSELALRRAEYSAVLKRDGFQKLVEDVDRRVAELASVN
jgi:phospholipid transport system substrate-binding protein